MLKGQAKKDYQREYMRQLRFKGRLLDPSVRPLARLEPNVYIDGETFKIIELDADGNPVYEE